ncbi:MAG: Leucyl aminopeptidase (aminopeptidase T)-like protein [Clostridiales bacterium]|jgi:leucyl aminopeptidase (aminopeptidase T)|nr:Leucyl aminopeptidase (aminopeptidase T)-like protein [Clostridiales bacterium]
MFNKITVNKIVKAFEIEKRQIVLLQFWGEDEDRKTLHDFSYAVAANGGVPIELQHAKTYYNGLFENMPEQIFGEKYFSIFKEVDVVIDICMYAAVIPDANFPKDKMNFYREYMKNMFATLVKKDKFIQLRVPSEAFANEANIDPNEFIERMTDAYDIDYDKLKSEADTLINSLSSKSKVVIRTGNDCNLTLSLSEREWHGDTGTGDMPCGEIYIAPIEYSSDGNLFIDTLYFEDNVAKEITLEIEGGMIVSSSDSAFNDFLSELPPNGNVIGEFGIGLNENVKSLCGYPVLDEKMKNTYHIGIGQNTMFGGTVDSMCHIDLVFTGEVSFVE